MAGCLFEGLLAGGVSIANRGMDNLLWAESEGVFYRLDDGVKVGMDVFVAGGDWCGNPGIFDATSI